MRGETLTPRRAAFWVVVDAMVLVYALLPVLWIFSLSLKPSSNAKDGKLFPSSMTLENYRGIFRGDFFSSALINSIGIGLITTVIAVVLGAMAAYAIARLDFPGKRLLVGMTLLITMFRCFRCCGFSACRSNRRRMPRTASCSRRR
ncbi:hypothetical protein Mkiyose1088_28730 [Mycobacterium kiyosense]|nr:hypothetical protein Mkiyose1088_28730 [Mycobacterium kiyosense]